MNLSVSKILDKLVDIVSPQCNVKGIILLGSYARGDNRNNSNVNVTIIALNPSEFFKENSWIEHFGKIFLLNKGENDIISLRIACIEEIQMHLNIVPLTWAETDPIDPETLKVILDGVRVLWDPDNLLHKLISFCQNQSYLKFLSYKKNENKGKMIILLGTSTSGKSTIINTISTVDPDILNFSIDLCFENKKADIIKTIDFDNYQTLISVLKHSEIAKIIETNDKIKYQPNVTNLQKLQVERAIAHLREKIRKIDNLMPNDMFEMIFRNIVIAANNGDTLICDVVYPDVLYRYLFNKIVYGSVCIVLVYCPLLELSNRLSNRNHYAHISQKPSEFRRSFPLFQYIKLYKKKEFPDEPVLETLTRNDAEKVFDEQVDNLEKHRKHEFLELLGFTDNNITAVEITPRFKFYNYVIDTSKLSATQAVTVILSNQV